LNNKRTPDLSRKTHPNLLYPRAHPLIRGVSNPLLNPQPLFPMPPQRTQLQKINPHSAVTPTEGVTSAKAWVT